MTYEQTIKQMLFDRGLFDNQASEIFELLKADKCNESMKGRWSDQVDDYPESMFLVLWVSAKDIALRWIDANCPKAWYRPLFM